MTESRCYLTTAIPYVNARPHLGFALEVVQADALARHRRQRGDNVRFVTGTDDNALKNVYAARAAGMPVRDFVDTNAAQFGALRDALQLRTDDFFRTSANPLHNPGVERLWRACEQRGDIYEKEYQGLYCLGCEQFYEESELQNGLCAEHGTTPELVSERNWFFRLSRYQNQLLELVESNLLQIEPEGKRNEVLAFIRSGLHDFSTSRSSARSPGWGVPVPSDPSQVVYVWWDALGYYITSLGYGVHDEAFTQWWEESHQRIQIVGKGIIRFHAVYWPAILLSAGLSLPSRLFVHDYLTIGGNKISKSLGNVIDPFTVSDEFGSSALRWWLLRDVPRTSDADYSASRLVERWNNDIASGIGNLVNRVVALVHKFADGRVPVVNGSLVDRADLTADIEEALDKFDFRSALTAIEAAVYDANRYIETTRPWHLAKTQDASLAAVLARLVDACRAIGTAYEPFVPDVASAIETQLTTGDNGTLPKAEPLFQRLSVADKP